MKKRIVALTPMRHHSERVPGKNYRDFAGRPLFWYILDTLQNCTRVDEIAVDTDSPLISKAVTSDFPEVLMIERPTELSADTVPMNDILLYDVQQVAADLYIQTHATNPLLRSDTIDTAISQFLKASPRYDSLFSVTRLQCRLWDAKGNPVNHDPSVLLRTQDLAPIYIENSCLYIFTRDSLEAHQNRIGERPLMFEIDRSEAWDIDDETDFRVAEFLYRERLQGG